MNTFSYSFDLPSFKLDLTFDEAGTVYAAMKLAAMRVRAEGAADEADKIESIANRLLPSGNAAVYSVNLDAPANNEYAAYVSLSIDDAADIYAALMTVATLAHSAGDHDSEHRLQALAERVALASLTA